MSVKPPSCLQAVKHPGGLFGGHCYSSDILHESIPVILFWQRK